MNVISVMAAYSNLMRVCVVPRAGKYCQYPPARGTTHAQQVGICSHNTDNVHIDKQSGTILVILARP
jgi:hypothetical protein